MYASISFNQSHKSSISHNNRKHTSGNPDIDEERIHENIYYIQRPIQDVYLEVFDEAVEEYNKKQTRNDRKIENYYEKIHHDKKTHEQRELVIAIGKKDDGLSAELKKEVLDSYAKEFQERNPNLAVYNMVLHLDEANPHLHINYVPHFESKRGLAKRTGMDKALQQQGIEGKGVELIKNWREKETARIERLCEERFPSFIRENVGSHKYMKVRQYKEFAESLTELAKEKEQIALESVAIAEIAKEKREEVKVLSHEFEIVGDEYKAIKNDINKLKKEYELKKEEVQYIDEKIRVFSHNPPVKHIEVKRAFLKSDVIQVKEEDWKKVLSKAEVAEVLAVEKSKVERENKMLLERNQDLNRHVVRTDQWNGMLLKENNRLKKEVKILNAAIEKLKEVYKEKLPELAHMVGYCKAFVIDKFKDKMIPHYFKDNHELAGAQNFAEDKKEQQAKEHKKAPKRDYGLGPQR